MFVRYVTYAVFSISTILGIILVLYCIKHLYVIASKNKQNLFKHFTLTAGSVLLSLALFFSLITLFMIAAFTCDPMHIVEKNGKKMIANVTISLSTRYVEYYDYKCFFICGNTVRIKENYQEGTDDPLKSDNETLNTVMSTVYYDENGNVISYYKHPDDQLYRPY